ncbi:carbohydrate ABC transporter permease [Microbacterium esteraromaticum]|uniref:Carbohydrate ABC transporter permease n=1 Tax=Microbacterium esteraromaticum TaxID=57043 RepID=A0A7D8A9F7_9MICO|nr:carbohydrate ABC transporter permease [Microbacterium esteraromaticum]QMU96421.1 carbohydrate ABC transporter permease [Microbacterium esteraromaticum]
MTVTMTERLTTSAVGPRRRRPRTSLWQRGGVMIALIALTVVTAFPILVVALSAFSPEAEVNSWPPSLVPSQLTIANFVELAERLPVIQQSWNSLVFAGAVTGCALVLNALAAYALARIDFRGKTVIFTILIATMMIPFQALLIPIYQMVSGLGWVNTFLGLVIPRAADVAGIFLLRQFFVSLPRDLDSAARIDGAGEVRIFWSIILPNAKPALLTMALFHFVGNWNDLLWPLIMTSDSEVRPLTAGLALLTGSATGAAPYSVMMAGALVAILPLVVLYLLIQRKFIEGVALTGMKG